ncbi:MAG: hypothetical protein IT453_12185, partial [Planctomycetes bacterium]|nr:hypothetical protein [Planctomycetota bacterium]
MTEAPPSLRAWRIAGIATALMTLAVGLVGRASDASFGDEALALLRYHSNLGDTGVFVWNAETGHTVGAISPLQFTLLSAIQVFVHEPTRALAAASALSGVVGLIACFVLARGAARSARDSKLAFDWLVALVVGLAAVPLAVQFTGGLEASLSFAMTGVFTWLWSKRESVDVPVGGLVLGAFGAALFATRADLGLFGLGVPLVVAVLARDAERRQALVALGVAALGTAGVSYWLFALHGSPVPIAFLLRHAAREPFAPWHELAHGLVVTAPLWGLVAVELVLRRGAPKLGARISDHAFGLATLAFVLDATVGALAVDVSSLRFLLAALPPLVFLAARAAVGLRRWADWRGRRPPSTPFVLLAVGAVLAPLPALWSHVELVRDAYAVRRIARYESVLTPERCARWPGLAELAPLAPPPNDLERGRLIVACAPAGEVGAALPLAQVVDLSG